MAVRHAVSSVQECRLRLHGWARSSGVKLFHLNETISWRFRGDFRPQAMEQAVRKVVERHDTLTATYVIDGPDGEPIQILRPDVAPVLAYSDMRDGDEAAARRMLSAESHEHLPLHEAPQVRGRIVRLGEDDHVFTLLHPSLMMDHWGYEVFVRDLAAFYDAIVGGTEADLDDCLPFSQYAELDHRCLRDGTWDPTIDYWRDQYQGESPLPILHLPQLGDAGAGRIAGARLSGEVGAESVAALRKAWSELSGEAITPYAFMLSVMVSLFSERLDLDAVGILVPAANRTDWEYHDTVGAFSTILAPRFRNVRDRSFVDLCKHVYETLLDSLEHQQVSYHEMMRRFDPSRYGQPLRSPFCYFDYWIEDSRTATTPTFGGLEPEPFALEKLPTEEEGVAMVFFDDGGPTIGYGVSYAQRYFTEEQARKLAREVEAIAVSAAADPYADVPTVVRNALKAGGDL